jgi:hypothetical protein
MSDGRKNNGAKKGVSQGQGRMPKSDEIKLAEKIRSIISDESLIQKLADIARDDENRNQYKAIELLTGYLYGKPTQRIETKELEDLPEIHFVRATKKN